MHQQQEAYNLQWDESPNCGPDCLLLVNETGNYSTRVYMHKAINCIREHEHSEEPLFLYLAFQAVHSPRKVPEYYGNDKEEWTEKLIAYAGMLSAADEGIGNVTATL
jgi:arylsulfatase A-like enzyme